MKLRFTPKQLYMITAVVVPGAMLVGARFLGDGAANAQADTSLGAIPALPQFERGASDLKGHGALVIARGASILTGSLPPSPFPVPDTSSNDPDPASQAPYTGVEPMVQLTGVANAGRMPIAVIDGRPRGRGEEVEPGWRITSISVPTRSVTLTHASGVEYRLTLDEFESRPD